MQRSRLGLLGAGALVVAASTCVLADPAQAVQQCSTGVDVAVSAPSEDVSGAQDAGSVTLSYTSEPGSGGVVGSNGYQQVTASDLALPPEAGARFGSAVAIGVDSEECTWVAIGSPGANGGAGSVVLFRLYDRTVFDRVAYLSQGRDGIEGSAEPGDHFGASLAFSANLGTLWLAVGTPGEDIGSTANAGLVDVIPVGAFGAADVAVHQGSTGVPGAAEAGDAFGTSLIHDGDGLSLAVGSPGEDVGTRADAGAVVLLPGDLDHLPGSLPAKVLTQDSAGVPGTAEKGDRFGQTLAAIWSPAPIPYQLAVGAPGEDVGDAADAGTVTYRTTPGTYRALQQGSSGTPGAPEAGDHFGAALAGGVQCLAVGSPDEDLGTVKDAGQVHVYVYFPEHLGGPVFLSPNEARAWSQDTAGVRGNGETTDRFGASVAWGRKGLVVGAPGEDGAVQDEGSITTLLRGADETGPWLVRAGQQLLTQDSPGVPDDGETGDAWGATGAGLT
jgi:FG-GAP repeat